MDDYVINFDDDSFTVPKERKISLLSVWIVNIHSGEYVEYFINYNDRSKVTNLIEQISIRE